MGTERPKPRPRRTTTQDCLLGVLILVAIALVFLGGIWVVGPYTAPNSDIGAVYWYLRLRAFPALIGRSASPEDLAALQAAWQREAPPDKSAADLVDPRRLVAEPNAFRGKNIVLQGQALTVTQQADYTWVQLMAQPTGRETTESVVAEVRPKNVQILKDDCYRVYGVGSGTQNVNLTLTGASREVPLIRAYAVEGAPAGPRGIGCNPP